MKAYGIRFDVMVNGKVCGAGLIRGGAHWAGSWAGSGWSPGGGPTVHPALLTLSCLSVLHTGREVQHHPHNHQRGLWAGTHGCCEYLPSPPAPSEHWQLGGMPQRTCPHAPERRRAGGVCRMTVEGFGGLCPPLESSGGHDCLRFSAESQRGTAWGSGFGCGWGSLGSWANRSTSKPHLHCC